MQSLQLYVFGPQNSGLSIKGEFNLTYKVEITSLSLSLSLSLSIYIYIYIYPVNLYLDALGSELKVDKHSVGGCGGLIRRKKGAVAICMSYNGIQMVFISCHLSGTSSISFMSSSSQFMSIPEHAWAEPSAQFFSLVIP